MTQLGVILEQVDSGTMLLPEFQRGYVWNRDQVRGLMRSLYRGYPVGGLLTWDTETDGASVRGSAGSGPGFRQLLLDGQQRVTSLYGVIRGRPPARPELMARFPVYVERLARLHGLLQRDFHAEKITGPDKTVDIVVDIFNRVNSGGTKLSKGDLALARICAEWPEARGEMRTTLEAWKASRYTFTLDWLLRNVNAVATGRAPFSALEDVPSQTFADALQASVKYVGGFLDIVAGRLGLDHDRVLMGRYAFPVVSRFLHLNGGRFADGAQMDRMLYWYVHAALWGRFAGSTETVLAQDYEAVERAGIHGLISSLERWRGGNLGIDGQDFEGFGRGSRFYPLLYLLTRVLGARDLCSGLELKATMLGYLASLQVHHIFPKARLYEAGYSRVQVNAVANFCFLTQDCNLTIGKRRPEDYFPQVEAAHPGVLASQWIPAHPTLWRIDRYPDFLAARRELLADAANSFLDHLRSGTGAATAVTLERIEVSVVDEEDDDRSAQVTALVEDLAAAGYARPVLDGEIADPQSGRVLAVAEAHWPDGLQPGQGGPVVLELDPEEADLPRLEELGYEVFTSVGALRGFAHRRSEVAAGLRQDGEEAADADM